MGRLSINLSDFGCGCAPLRHSVAERIDCSSWRSRRQRRDAGRLEEAQSLYRRGVALQPDWSEVGGASGDAGYDRSAFAPARDAFFASAKSWSRARLQRWRCAVCAGELKEYPPSLDDMERGHCGWDSIRLLPLLKVTRYHAALLLTHSGAVSDRAEILCPICEAGGGGPSHGFGHGVWQLCGYRCSLPSCPLHKKGNRLSGGTCDPGSRTTRKVTPAKEIEALIAANPQAPELHSLLGQLLVVSDPDAALEQWKQELVISPKHTPARLQIAFEYLQAPRLQPG